MQASLIKFITVATALSATPFALRAQDNDGAEYNHFGAEARLGFNIRAKFKGEGAVLAPLSPAAGGAVNRAYADGFVNVDSTGNQAVPGIPSLANGSTGNFQYQNAAQIAPNNTLLFHASAVDGTTTTRSDDPSLGFDFYYVRDMEHTSWGSWGFKFTFGYNRINLSDNQPQTANATAITDAYPFPPAPFQLPLAPYTGSFNGAGAVIGSTPARTAMAIPGGALITGNRSLDATVYDLRIGPTADFWLSKRFSMQVSAGLALGVADSTFSFSEITTTGVGAFSAAGTTHDVGTLVGAYAEANFAYRFWRQASVTAGVEFEYLGNYQQNNAGRNAQLDLSQAIFCKAGLAWSF